MSDNATSHGMNDVQRYVRGAAEAELQPTHHHNPVRIIEGALSVSSADGVITETFKGQESARSSEASPFHGAAGIFGTARNQNGTPAMSIGDATLLTLPDGMQATAKTLAQMGIITRNPDGTYSEAAGQPEDQSEEFAGDLDPIPAQLMDHVNAALEPLPQAHLDGFAAVAVGVAAGKLDPSAMAAKFSHASGVDLQEAQARIDSAAEVYRLQTGRALAKHGIGKEDREAFFDWCRRQKPEAMQEAISRQLHAHDVSRWAPLARQWMAQAAPSVEALKAAGIPTRKSAHGATGAGSSVEVFIRGSWMSAGAAARAGLL